MLLYHLKGEEETASPKNMNTSSDHLACKNVQSADDLNEEILSELVCPVCLEYILPPVILICNNGHNVCSVCSLQLQECPTCRSAIVRIKNVVLENIARKIQYRCTNRKWGCEEMFPSDLISDHQAVCIQMPRNCPFANPSPVKCSWIGPTDKMKSHLTEVHKRIAITVPDGEKADLFADLNKKEEVAMEKIIMTCKEMFYVRSGLKGDNFYTVVRYVDVKKDSPKFKYEFCIKKNGGNEAIRISNFACSINEDVDEIREAGKCVLIPYNVVKNYLQVVFIVTNLLYYIKIQKVVQ